MNLLSVENISKSYGEKIIFDNITFGIDTGDKIGVIGVNGTGKSTLLKIVAGVDEADSGKIVTMKGLRVSYLPQTPYFNENETVIDYVHRICGEMTSAEESEAKSALTKLGIFDYYKNVAELSGGQKKRVAIAACMSAPVDLLILDEPTNHLDSNTILWLEQNFKKSAKAILLVTHDRYFLDRVANKTFELDKGKIYVYEGNYTKFLEQKALREELETAAERKRQNFLRTELEWVRRGAKARTTKQKARLERFEEISNIKAPEKKKNIEIAALNTRLGRKTIEINNVSKSYDEKIIDDFSYIVLKNDRIGIIGENGCGKTTLIKIMTGEIKPDSGFVEIGETVKIGVFSQEYDKMDPNMRVIDYVKEVGEYIITSTGRISASQLLERFLFDGEIQYSPISKLSGGEKRRLYLLRVLMASPNILFLDEPTNDLDIETLAILEDYLDNFKGAVISVSHDRYFLDRVCDRIFAFEEKGKIKQYEGGFTDYYLAKKESEKPETVKEEKVKKTWDKGKQKLKFSFNEQKEYETIDDDIAKLEEKISEIEKAMAENSSIYSKLQELSEEKEKTEALLAEKMDRWIYLNELAEKINNQ
ncbi:MAG: ABC-F family ATP-binding cassette domain-containing protein [Lachnospirales bacterium]